MLPPLLVSLYKLRKWATYFRSAGDREEWFRLGFGGSAKSWMHLDSSADWGSTLKMDTWALQHQDSLAAFAGRVEDTPALPAAGEWLALKKLEACLTLFQHGMTLLQSDWARAAQVLPTIASILDGLRDLAIADDPNTHIPTAFGEELQRAIDKHLKQKFAPIRPNGDHSNKDMRELFRRSKVESYLDLLQLAQILCEPPAIVAEDARAAEAEDAETESRGTTPETQL